MISKPQISRNSKLYVFLLLNHFVLGYLQDLDYLSEGLEGRSFNPVALLFDQLLHPNTDLGSDQESCLKWHYHGDKALKHVVIGCGPPGGSWHNMQGSQLTLSLNNWLELPGLEFQDWLREHRCESTRKPCNLVTNGIKSEGYSYDRATTSHIAEYYKDFVDKMNLENNFLNDARVLSVRQVQYGEGCCNRYDTVPLHRDGCWEISGIRGLSSKNPQQFVTYAYNVVLATGTNVPKMLRISGENCPFVFHQMKDLNNLLDESNILTTSSDPCLVIGSGLSAGDAILALQNNGIPVVHSFRRAAKDPKIVFNQLPVVVYPEYYRVRQMIRGEIPLGDGAADLYTSYPETRVIEICHNRECVLQRADGTLFKQKVSFVFVLIGANPDLSFLRGTQSLGNKPKEPLDSKKNPVDVNPFSYESVHEPGLFAVGPLAGDTFVRFGLGGSLGAAGHLIKGDVQISPTNQASSVGV